MLKREEAGEPAFLERQRARLSAMRDKLLDPDAAGTAPSRVPRTAEAVEREDDAQDLAQSEVDGAVRLVEEHRLRLIERALAKIYEGTYGLSDLSGDPIPKARLEAIPEAIFTIQEEEARERRHRR